jgi:ATP-dependent DNA helicase
MLLFGDKNPQMDLQAQDRAHRIGQTRPVLIYRLVSRHTIESKIMQRASEKRQLEALVIAKGKFNLTPLSYPITTASLRLPLLRMAEIPFFFFLRQANSRRRSVVVPRRARHGRR